MYKRYLNMNLEKGQSAFLWGARKTGKSTYLKEIFSNSAKFDLLSNKTRSKFESKPWSFRAECIEIAKTPSKLPIIIDEIQKVPQLLDEIHWLIENTNCYFVMCGSSSRQFRKPGINLLGGRALRYHFAPLVYSEIKEEFDLIRIMNHGLVPVHFQSSNYKRLIDAYVEDYLYNEIKYEGYVRELRYFSRFLESIAFCHGEMINYSNIARDVGIDAKTVKEYYQILEDTLIGHLIYPYYKNPSRRVISSVPKFYLFDVGIANFLIKRDISYMEGAEAGKSLEHYIFMELMAYIRLNLIGYKIDYWRTHSGLEVDFIISYKTLNPVPIEVKISQDVHKTEFRAMRTFMKDHQIQKGYLVCMVDAVQSYIIEDREIIVYPAREFLEDLWAGKILKE